MSMGKKVNDINGLINKAIDDSIKFEALMDSTDFDSWLEDDSSDRLKEIGQEITPFENFKKNKEKLRNICLQMQQKGTNELPKNEDKSSLERYLIYQLFEAKIKRLDAKISSKSEAERDNYKEALHLLFAALNHLQILEIDESERYWRIFFYNDLSICYAGLRNSSISRGYAEEARRIIEKEESYKEFDKKLNGDELTEGTNIENHNFVSSKLYDLYIVAIFNQAEAERRSYLYAEAERNFKKIINYAEKKAHLINFNYYSAIVNLSDLYIDQGRGKESLELLERVIDRDRLNKDDVRYWKASLEMIAALIDQSKYDEAERLLVDKFLIKKKENGFTLRERHKVTYPGFNALIYFARSRIEKVSNTLKMPEKDKECNLKEAEKVIDENIENMKNRKQKESEKTAYKHLGNIFRIFGKEKDAIKNLTKFLSMGEIDDLNKFVSHKKMENWINECEDLDTLESFTELICKKRNDGTGDITGNSLREKLLPKILGKIKEECEDRAELSRAERIATKINEVLGEGKYSFLGEIKPFSERYSKKENGLNGEYIRKRLDINEKEFDSTLFKRSKIREDHLVQVIVLRRWNSFSPGLFRRYTGSLGGGYLLRINKTLLKGENKEELDVENIVIDPGYNFLQNFCSEGFSIKDIDTIIITHSHLDHCSELLPIMDLIYQINKRYDKYYDKSEQTKKRVNLCLSQGAYNKFKNYTIDPDWQKQLKDIIILENLPEKKWDLDSGLTISAIPTPHMDLGGVKAIGLKIEIDRNRIGGEPKKLCLGFTGDTPWYEKISEDFKGCNLLCVHLGSIKYQEIGYTDDRYNIEDKPREIPEEEKFEKLKEIYTKSNHLLFFGTENIIKSCAKAEDDKLIIVGEFGEELKYGLRIDLCRKLSEGNSTDCLPGDIGLYIGIDKDGIKKVRCNFCEEFVGQKEITTFLYGREDAIHYICRTCNKTLSELQKQAFVEHRVTRH